jgi:hypothetical protein
MAWRSSIAGGAIRTADEDSGPPRGTADSPAAQSEIGLPGGILARAQLPLCSPPVIIGIARRSPLIECIGERGDLLGRGCRRVFAQFRRWLGRAAG